MNHPPFSPQTPYTPQTPPIPPYRIAHRPSQSRYLMWSLITAAAVAFLPYLGVVSYPLMCAALLFLVSAKAPLWAFFPPAAGVIGLFFVLGGNADPVTLAVMYTVVAALLSSLAAGGVLCRKDGDFHRALTVFTAVASVTALTLVALTFRKYGVTPEALTDKCTELLLSAVERMAASEYNTLPAEELAALRENAPNMIRESLYYFPAVVAIMIEVCGVISLRVNGLIHDSVPTAYYHPARRPAKVDRMYAVLFFASIVATLAGGSTVVGITAGNVMLILLVPAVAAGVSAYRLRRMRRRAEGKPSGIFPVLIFVGLVLYLPVLALYIPAVYGCIAGFKQK